MFDHLAYIVAASLHRDFDRNYLPLPEKQIILAAAGARSVFARRGRGQPTDLPPPDPPPPVENPSADAGAALPITYTIASLGGTPRYVEVNGNGVAPCAEADPCGSISTAQSAASVNDPIILRGGTYTNTGNTWSGSAWGTETFITKAGIKLYAYPGETVTFDGSLNIFSNTWTTEGNYKYASYTPRPCANADAGGNNNTWTSAYGIVFCKDGSGSDTIDNLKGNETTAPYNVGKWNDQLWIDGVPIQQVVRKDDLRAGTPGVAPDPTFWVDRTQYISGTATASAGSSTLTGTGTNFTVLLKPNDSITVGGQTKTVTSITSNTSLSIAPATFSPAISAQVVTRNGNNRIYLMGSVKDAAVSEIAVCERGDFLSVQAANVEWHGFTVKRYCNTQSRAAMIDIQPTADNFRMEDVVVEDAAAMAVYLQGSSSDALTDATLEHVTISGAQWVGTSPDRNNGLLVNKVKIQFMDRWDEFSGSPMSGALKTSRNAHTRISNSLIQNNRSQGIWFDQSNWGPTYVFSNTITNTGQAGEDTSFFYEISYGLRFYNNYIRSPIGTNVKIAGSNDAYIYNNTLIGGKDVLGIYADSRSLLTCATTGTAAVDGTACTGFSSDRWGSISWLSAPAGMDWLTDIKAFQGNIVGYPTAVGLCGGLMTAVCFVRRNDGGAAYVEAVLELANILPNGVDWDCNVYATTDVGNRLYVVQNPAGSSWITYTTTAAFTTAMDGAAPYPDETGLDANALTGTQYVNADGTPAPALDALNDVPASIPEACAFPTDATMNATIPAGTKHYGVLWQ